MSDKLIKDILAKYDEDFTANTWLVPGGKARAIKHQCIERMAAKAGVFFDKPNVISADPENVVMIVYGTLWAENEHGKSRERQEWSFGEASPKNNKNQYPYSMAEKRGKDRVALKLIGLHGLLYSEEEADDFKQAVAPAHLQTSPTESQLRAYDKLEVTLQDARSIADLDLILRNEAENIAKLPEELKDNLRKVVRFVREARKVAA